jgi:hypothetical protein
VLVKDETKYCWVLDEYAGAPQNSIEDAIKDFIETYGEAYETGDSDHSYMCDCYMPYKKVNIGHPYYYVPKVDAERVIEDICDYDVEDEIAEWSEPYMCKLIRAKRKHIEELEYELTKVYQEWEKRHGYENTSYVVLETKQYLIGDYVKDDKC